MNRISLVITVLNEEKTINKLILSIASQSQLPDELIIVDGGSSDKTTLEIEKLKNTLPKKIKLKVFKQIGNRSVGRNLGIKNSKGNLILITDAGCILDKNWVKKIVKPFESKSVSVVAGYYQAKAKNIFQKCLAPFVLVMKDKVNPDRFLPASRSMAFRKNVWEKLGGFDENFSHNEDYVFAKKLQKNNVNIYFQPEAIVNWIPRNNLYSAFIMFFRFALGDAEAKIFRPKVFTVFLRYLVFFLLWSLSSTVSKPILLKIDSILFFLYLTWAIVKNFKYCKSIHSLYWLPVLQITSDFAVMGGTLLGIWKSINLIRIIKKNRAISLIILAYSTIVLSGLNWGIPNQNHPFNYHMDEWAQAQSVRFIFKYGSPNINGASHGAIFQYFLGGVFLVPFVLLHIVNPLVIKNSLLFIEMQQRLFQILRLNTLLFGIGTIITVAIISKKYLKVNPVIASLLVTFTPIFLLLSNFFKYDIAVSFWVGFSLLSAFWYGDKPTKTRLFLMSFFCALAFASKVSAIPTIAIIPFSFFLFNKKPFKNIFTLFQALAVYIATFLLLGIPDLPFHFKEYADWWRINVQIDPNLSKNQEFGEPYWTFLFDRVYPAIFGRGFIGIYYLSVIFAFFLSLKYLVLKQFNENNKRAILLTLTLFAFIASVVPLKFDASGNRMTVFLPLLALASTLLISKAYKNLSRFWKKVSTLLFILVCVYQVLACLAWISIRVFPDVREVSSKWFVTHIKPGTSVGMLNPPIFEGPPDFLLKEFYEKVYFPNTKTVYRYVAYDQNTKNLPEIVIMNSLEHNLKYAKDLPRNKVYFRLQKEGYKLIAKFTPNFTFYKYFGDDIDFGFSGLLPVENSISIFQKNQ